MAVKLLLLVVLASLAFCVAFAARDLTETQSSIPSSIQLPEDSHHHYKLHRAVHARGYQHYKYNGTAWEQFNATARLYDTESNKQVGRHFFLPELDRRGGQATWESLRSEKNGGVSFSIVTCKTVSKVVVDADSIPWVLLKTTQASGSKQFFGEVVFVQRVKTKLGLAPKSSKGDCVGDVKKTPYTSDYLFYVSVTQHH